MQPSEVLAHEPRVLTQEQRELYFEDGYLLVESVVPPEWLERLRAATDEMVDRSRALSHSDRIFDLEKGHTSEDPRLRRLTSPVDHHPHYWAFASEPGSVLPDIMADLAGPAGSITIHNCRVVHGSRPNHADAGRPLLLNVYSAADAFPYTANPLPSSREGEIVRGRAALWADHDPRPCLVPPDWSGGYPSLFALQQQEKWEDVQSRP